MEGQDNLFGELDVTFYFSHLGLSSFNERVLSSDVSIHYV